ncbi:MAG: hypothetical protein IJM52_08725, partial [Spirochaetales bacterium]|nr:hypothetical protein [Spirochaetales bacterium]
MPQGGDFTVPQTAATLPEGVVLPENFSSENAMQLIQYLLGNYVDFADFQTLFQGSMENGEFDMPQGGPQDMPPAQSGPFMN